LLQGPDPLEEPRETAGEGTRIDFTSYQALMTVDGGEVFTPPF